MSPEFVPSSTSVHTKIIKKWPVNMIRISLLISCSALLISRVALAEDANKKCSTLPRVQHRLNSVIVECQNQVKEDMIRDALHQLRYTEHQQPFHGMTSDYPGYPLNPDVPLANEREDIHWMLKRVRRDIPNGLFYDHPTVMTNDDKEIAGVSPFR